MGLFRKGVTPIAAKFHRTALLICSHSREGKTSSYLTYTLILAMNLSISSPTAGSHLHTGSPEATKATENNKHIYSRDNSGHDIREHYLWQNVDDIKFQILLVIEMKITFLSEDIIIPRAKRLGGR